jgi:hypothetical protein
MAKRYVSMVAMHQDRNAPRCASRRESTGPCAHLHSQNARARCAREQRFSSQNPQENSSDQASVTTRRTGPASTHPKTVELALPAWEFDLSHDNSWCNFREPYLPCGGRGVVHTKEA